MDHSQPLAEKTAIITGASRGIGRAISMRLAREGAHVVICARDGAALDEVSSAIKTVRVVVTRFYVARGHVTAG